MLNTQQFHTLRLHEASGVQVACSSRSTFLHKYCALNFAIVVAAAQEHFLSIADLRVATRNDAVVSTQLSMLANYEHRGAFTDMQVGRQPAKDVFACMRRHASMHDVSDQACMGMRCSERQGRHEILLLPLCTTCTPVVETVKLDIACALPFTFLSLLSCTACLAASVWPFGKVLLTTMHACKACTIASLQTLASFSAAFDALPPPPVASPSQVSELGGGEVLLAIASSMGAVVLGRLLVPRTPGTTPEDMKVGRGDGVSAQGTNTSGSLMGNPTKPLALERAACCCLTRLARPRRTGS